MVWKASNNDQVWVKNVQNKGKNYQKRPNRGKYELNTDYMILGSKIGYIM